MTRKVLILVSGLAMSLVFAACWSPSVAEVPITAPWDKMNLPVKQDARVWFSDEKEVRVAHKGRRADIAKIYFDILEKDGWKIMEEALLDENIIVSKYEKNGRRIMISVNDFEGGAGVFIKSIS